MTKLTALFAAGIRQWPKVLNRFFGFRLFCGDWERQYAVRGMQYAVGGRRSAVFSLQSAVWYEKAPPLGSAFVFSNRCLSQCRVSRRFFRRQVRQPEERRFRPGERPSYCPLGQPCCLRSCCSRWLQKQAPRERQRVIVASYSIYLLSIRRPLMPAAYSLL